MNGNWGVHWAMKWAHVFVTGEVGLGLLERTCIYELTFSSNDRTVLLDSQVMYSSCSLTLSFPLPCRFFLFLVHIVDDMARIIHRDRPCRCVLQLHFPLSLHLSSQHK